MPDCGEPVSGSTAQSKVTCHKCKTQLCFLHEMPWHRSQTCEEVDRERHPKDEGPSSAQQQAEAEWLTVHTRLCPKCNVRIEKNGGFVLKFD